MSLCCGKKQKQKNSVKAQSLFESPLQQMCPASLLLGPEIEKEHLKKIQSAYKSWHQINVNGQIESPTGLQTLGEAEREAILKFKSSSLSRSTKTHSSRLKPRTAVRNTAKKKYWPTKIGPALKCMRLSFIHLIDHEIFV